MPKLGSITSKLPPDVKQFLDRVREALSGSGTDALVTMDDLLRVGIAQRVGGQIVPGGDVNINVGGGSGGGGSTPTYAAPPAPTGLTVNGAMASIIVQWDAPTYTGHGYTEIWAADTNTFGLAVMVGMAPGAIFVHDVGGSATRYYWIRFVNRNVEYTPGNYNAIGGTVGTTGTSPAYLIDLLANADSLDPVIIKADAFKITDTTNTINPFIVIATPTTVNGVAVSPGVYMDGAWIENGTINNAKIGNAAIDNAKIASLSAAKVTFGEMHGDRITLGTLQAGHINTATLSAISANMGTVTAGTMKTAAGTGWRAELSSAIAADGNFYPFWFGNGTKNAANAKFYLKDDGGAFFGGSINVANKFTVGTDGAMSAGGGKMTVAADGTTTIYDMAGNIILASGSGVDWSKVSNKSGDNVVANPDFFGATDSTVNCPGWVMTKSPTLVNGYFAYMSNPAWGWGPDWNRSQYVAYASADSSDDYCYILSDFISVDPTKDYSLAFWRKSFANTQTIGQLQCFDVNNAYINTITILSVTDAVYAWTRLSGVAGPGGIAFPSNTAVVKVLVWITSGIATGNAMVTRVTLNQGKTPTTTVTPYNPTAVSNVNRITSANISTYIASLAVGTLQIAGNSISYTTYFTSSTVTLVTHGTVANPTSVLIAGKLTAGVNGGSTVLVRLLVDGVERDRSYLGISTAYMNGTVSLHFVYTCTDSLAHTISYTAVNYDTIINYSTNVIEVMK